MPSLHRPIRTLPAPPPLARIPPLPSLSLDRMTGSRDAHAVPGQPHPHPTRPTAPTDPSHRES